MRTWRGYRGAALLLWKRERGEIFILMERRGGATSYPGQWTIPGGGREPSDADDESAALRECAEELDGGNVDGMRAAYKNRMRRIIRASLPFIYSYSYFIARATSADAARNEWIPQPHEVSKGKGSVAWFPIRALPSPLHITIRPLLLAARIRGLMRESRRAAR